MFNCWLGVSIRLDLATSFTNPLEYLIPSNVSSNWIVLAIDGYEK